MLTDAAQLHVYVRAEDGSAWQLDERMQQLTELVKAELTDVVAQERVEKRRRRRARLRLWRLCGRSA